ncbi:MAG: hypothetical protein AAF658_03995 [Myxococcota bacterium]
MDVTPSEAKQDLLRRLLEAGMVQVMLDARSGGVDVPTHLRGDYQLRLNLSYRFNNHMEIDQDGVEATLTVKGEPYTCRIPWHCLYMMVLTNNEDPPFIFPGDMPPELMHLANQLQDDQAREAMIEPEPEKKPQLTVIRSEDTGSDAGSPLEQAGAEVAAPDLPAEPLEESSGDEDPTPPKGRGHLRVVK